MHAQIHAIPPGIRQANQAEGQTQRNTPPPDRQRTQADPKRLKKLKRNADELAALAQSIPSEVSQTLKGTLPKDLNDHLKIELTKQLRTPLSQ